MLRAAVDRFVAEVAEFFARHWTPAPPSDEQIASLSRATPANAAEDGPR